MLHGTSRGLGEAKSLARRPPLARSVHKPSVTSYQPTAMAKCDEGYLCEVCGEDVAKLADSELYLRYVTGQLDPETLHTASERHIRCNPVVAQFIVDEEFAAVAVGGDFDKRNMDADYVRAQEELLTRGWRRLREIAGQGLSISDYPLPEFRQA